MSRWLEEQQDGTYKEVINDPDACRHELNEICGNTAHPYFGAWIEEGMCKTCPLFEKENVGGKINEKEPRKERTQTSGEIGSQE